MDTPQTVSQQKDETTLSNVIALLKKVEEKMTEQLTILDKKMTTLEEHATRQLTKLEQDLSLQGANIVNLIAHLKSYGAASIDG